MKSHWLFLFCLVFAAVPVLAQDPPINLDASFDGMGGVTLNWDPPLEADYQDDFEDGMAQGWIYDVDANWSVSNGYLAGELTPVSVQWTGGAYSTEMFSDQTAESTVMRSAGTASFSQALFMKASGPYGDVTGYTGYMFNIAPADFGGAFLVVKYVNDVATFITPAWVNFDMNIGVGSTNTQTVVIDGDQLTYFINGAEAFSFTDNAIADGHLGVGFAEDIGVYGRVEWDQVFVDDQAAAVASVPNDVIEMPVVDDSYIMQVPRTNARPVPQQKFQTDGLLTKNGRYVGTGQVDELDEFIEWRVYRNGSMLGTTTETTYDDQLPDFGAYDYTVTGFYDEGESEAAGPVTVVWQDPDLFPIDEDFDNGLPETWTVEGHGATMSWHVDYGDERGLFPTPYMLVDSDAPGSCPHLQERLITPEVALSNNTYVGLTFSSFFNMYAEEYGYVELSNDGGTTWNTIWTVGDDQEDYDLTLDITGDVSGWDALWISFYYDDLGNWGWYWGLDDIQLYTEGGDPDPVTLTLSAQNTIIPSGGGVLNYNVSLVSLLPGTYTGVSFWTEVMLPNGQMFGPLVQVPFTLIPFMDVGPIAQTQNIPAGAPAGTYTFYGYAGYPTLNVSDSFTFMKEGAAAGAIEFDPNDWAGSTPNFAGDADAVVQLPEEFELQAAYPNPFNPTTTVAVALPQAAELNVAVFNVMGQKVADLASGKYNAGMHNLVFDASALSSGVYFIQAQVPGELNTVQKVTLMK